MKYYAKLFLAIFCTCAILSCSQDAQMKDAIQSDIVSVVGGSFMLSEEYDQTKGVFTYQTIIDNKGYTYSDSCSILDNLNIPPEDNLPTRKSKHFSANEFIDSLNLDDCRSVYMMNKMKNYQKITYKYPPKTDNDNGDFSKEVYDNLVKIGAIKLDAVESSLVYYSDQPKLMCHGAKSEICEKSANKDLNSTVYKNVNGVIYYKYVYSLSNETKQYLIERKDLPSSQVFVGLYMYPKVVSINNYIYKDSEHKQAQVYYSAHYSSPEWYLENRQLINNILRLETRFDHDIDQNGNSTDSITLIKGEKGWLAFSN